MLALTQNWSKSAKDIFESVNYVERSNREKHVRVNVNS